MSHVPRLERPRRQPNVAAPPLQDDNKENDGCHGSTTKSRPKLDLDIDAFGEQLEKKYNIEGSNVLDTVYARRENDEAQAKIAAQAAQLDALKRQLASMKPAPARDDANQATIAAQAAQLDALTRQLASMQAAPARNETTNKPTDAPAGNDEDDARGDGPPTPARRDATNTPVGTGDEEDDPMEDDPAAVLARENAHLKRQLAKALASASSNPPGGAGSVPMVTIPRPRGTAGTHFSIRKSMGLDKTAKDGDLYSALIVR
ncbi:hypothetical protein B0H10DRAFT_2218228 [Mycena sp. CBHHK59/15]|nr:hypothetical protein B0H10DRAFT_2218228 [Mycena sp. CBHHK59/15]